MTFWTNADKARAFEWLRAVATAEGAPEEAGIAFDEWHRLSNPRPHAAGSQEKPERSIHMSLAYLCDVAQEVHAVVPEALSQKLTTVISEVVTHDFLRRRDPKSKAWKIIKSNKPQRAGEIFIMYDDIFVLKIYAYGDNDGFAKWLVRNLNKCEDNRNG